MRCLLCPKPAVSGGSRCAEHGGKRGSSKNYGWDYQQRRAQVLAVGGCWLCGGPGTPADPLEVDHVLSIATGGTHDLANLRAAHRSCNRARGARLKERLRQRNITLRPTERGR